MKIEKINDYKVKITISSIDLEERNIDRTTWCTTAPGPGTVLGYTLQAYVDMGLR